MTTSELNSKGESAII